MSIIYKTTNLVNGKIYVGKHYSSADDGYLGSGSKLNEDIKKYGKENFKREILEHCISGVDEREIYWIKKLKSINPNIGYNLRLGSYGVDSLSETHKQKIKMALLGKPKSKKHIENLKGPRPNILGKNNPFYGKHHSKDSKKKIANRYYHRGKEHYLYGKKLKTSFKPGKEHPKSIQIVINGIEYGSLREASRKLNISLWKLRKQL